MPPRRSAPSAPRPARMNAQNGASRKPSRNAPPGCGAKPIRRLGHVRVPGAPPRGRGGRPAGSERTGAVPLDRPGGEGERAPAGGALVGVPSARDRPALLGGAGRAAPAARLRTAAFGLTCAVPVSRSAAACGAAAAWPGFRCCVAGRRGAAVRRRDRPARAWSRAAHPGGSGDTAAADYAGRGRPATVAPTPEPPARDPDGAPDEPELAGGGVRPLRLARPSARCSATPAATRAATAAGAQAGEPAAGSSERPPVPATAPPAPARSAPPVHALSASAERRYINAHGANAASAKITTAARIVPTDALARTQRQSGCGGVAGEREHDQMTGLSITNSKSNRPRRPVQPASGGQIDAASATGKNNTAM